VNDDENAEDKLEKGSKREGKSAWDVAQFYTDAYFKNLDDLHIDRTAYQFPRATETIPEQIALIQSLSEKGYTYEIPGDGIYFDTSKFSAYRELARLDIEGLQSGARVTENVAKKNITDFALWKFSPKNEKRQMEWQSPWGVGFPGWHIECSAMSKMLLGSHFDIHMGGIDHIPVHHTNEIAQSECANGEHYVNYWMHYNFLNDQSGKMAKSNDDFLRLESLIEKGTPPLAYRYYLLTVHYRSEITFSFESLEAATVSYKKLLAFLKQYDTNTPGSVNDIYSKEFEKHIFEDVGTPGVIALIWKLIKDTDVSDADKVATIYRFDEVLGLDLSHMVKASFENVEQIPAPIQKLVDERTLAKNARDFKMSDALRLQIEEVGYTLKDTSSGTEITKK
jgi:cysteinyl-tRNA synthetase